ncbi:probable aminoacyl tRNA synthase complex-interacting multifunctional protein 2 isoform X2 [Ooceraea biroi]|uniref:Putative aminoacyl tRNA synthase complex-interacting multifunctional protein n=1 Tax=Ooceraea biroi TaxID=2015173 RepID=A0A026WS79_OOCBI|nr:probable aminoacyl tRNA synthase complex-interacting multifunctional protein 2 isoform X2 [Ooceraea biroi]EZA58521.1 putative aminoacyl tRNA synthase complex-interacting multifunctional protein [Ooceraea biroi]
MCCHLTAHGVIATRTAIDVVNHDNARKYGHHRGDTNTRVPAGGASERPRRRFFDFPSAREDYLREEMNDYTTTMYALRPIVTLPTIRPCSKPMYEMRNIHEDERDGRRSHQDANTDAKMPDDVITEQKPLPEYGALEIRQEKILNQLAELKKQVSTLCHFLKQSNKAQKPVKKICRLPPRKVLNINILIKANPRRRPYLIDALHKLWKHTDFRVKTYAHSTVKQEVPDYFPPRIISTTKNVVNVILIWKEVEQLEAYVDLQSEPLLGQVNLLRYLYRMIDPYENDQARVHLMDYVLDTCYVACYQKWKTVHDILYTLNSRFDEWSGKDKPNIADVAVWCLIKELNIISLPDPLQQMDKKYDEMFLRKKTKVPLFTQSNYIM